MKIEFKCRELLKNSLPLFLLIIVSSFVMLEMSLIVIYAVSCSNSASGTYTAVYVEAYISGTSPDTSSGGGRAWGEWTTPFGGNYCAVSGTMHVRIGCEYYYINYVGPIDRSYSKNFSPAGSHAFAEIYRNYCDGTTTAVLAGLYGTCIR